MTEARASWASECETESEGEDSAGSLVDFIEDDDGENTQEVLQGESSTHELDGINVANIVPGKRKRKQTKFYDQEVFASKEYQSMVLCDVPPDEMEAAFGKPEDELPTDDEDEPSFQEDEADDDESYSDDSGSDDLENDDSEEDESSNGKSCKRDDTIEQETASEATDASVITKQNINKENVEVR